MLPPASICEERTQTSGKSVFNLATLNNICQNLPPEAEDLDMFKIQLPVHLKRSVAKLALENLVSRILGPVVLVVGNLLLAPSSVICRPCFWNRVFPSPVFHNLF